MRPTALWPSGERARKRVSFVVAPLSSTNTNAVAGSLVNCSCQRALFSATSARSCSVANRVFFIRPTHLAQPQVYRGGSKRSVHGRSQFGQCGVRAVGQKLEQAFFALFCQQSVSTTQMSLWFERATILVLLAHPPDSGDAKP